MSAQKSRLYHRLQIAAHRVQKAADRAVLDAADVTTAQAAVLAIIAAQAPITQRDIASQLGINESAVTAMTGRLQKMGLLKRLRDSADARAWRLELTAEGRATLKRLEKPFKRVNQTLEEALSVQEIAQLADCLARISDAFEEF